MLDYLLGATGEISDESYLVRSDIIDLSFYFRRAHSMSGNFSHPPTNAIESDNECFYLPLFYDDDGAFVPTSIRAEAEQLTRTAAKLSISKCRDVFEEKETRRLHPTPGEPSGLITALSGHAEMAQSSGTFDDERIVEFPGLGCHLLVGEARVVSRRKSLCYAGLFGVRAADFASSETIMLGRYVTDLLSGDFVSVLIIGHMWCFQIAGIRI
jgi:hypothetical protein